MTATRLRQLIVLSAALSALAGDAFWENPGWWIWW